MTTAREIADSYWSDVFEVDRAELWSDGVRVTFATGGWDGVYVMRVGPSVRVRAPEQTRRTVDTIIRGVTLDALMSPSLWAAQLAPQRATVLGPASHFLTDLLVEERSEAQVLRPESLSSLAAIVSSDEWEESGVAADAAPLFGASADGQVVAVASLSEWADELSDVGVVTHPEFRGRGLGQTVAAAAINDAVSRVGFARWRSRNDNIPSIRLAKRLGLDFYGTNLGIRLR